MAGVSIELANGQLGQAIQTDDGIVGMVLTGGIDGTGDYVLGTPVLITGPTSLTAAGITIDGNAFAVRQVKDFYIMAGEGAQLYLMLVPNTLTIADMADKTNANGGKKLLDYAQGAIKVLGIMQDDNAMEIEVEDGLTAELSAALTNLHDMCDTYAGLQMPLRGIVAGTAYNGTPGDLADMKERTNNRVAVFIGDTVAPAEEDYAAAALGLLMGRIASIPVERMVSRVLDGALPTDTAFLGADEMEGARLYDLPILEGKGYITWRTFPHRSGYFFSDDHMCCPDNDDYSSLARARVIDKAQIIAYKTFLPDVDNKVPVDPTSGKLTAGYCRNLEQKIENATNVAMTSNGEIVSIVAFVDPAQNVLSTSKVAISIGVVPYGYSKTIEVKLGFVNPALAG